MKNNRYTIKYNRWLYKNGYSPKGEILMSCVYTQENYNADTALFGQKAMEICDAKSQINKRYTRMVYPELSNGGELI